jgi:hypothetical protein
MGPAFAGATLGFGVPTSRHASEGWPRRFSTGPSLRWGDGERLPSPSPDERPHIASELRAVLVVDVHHVAGMVIMVADALHWEAGAA